MRPSTLCAAFERIGSGESAAKAMPEFLDTFYTADDEARTRALADEPPFTGDAHMDALAAAAAEYLAKQHGLKVPAWVGDPRRVLSTPWFTTTADGPGMREWLVWSSPAEFVSRNIFTEERPLRRASQAQRKAD